ncbi:MAG: hypothetical protein M1376_05910 [Planctomycetes bacterium]|nr:hypothetical protein [Planctomycetota bacterium]
MRRHFPAGRPSRPQRIPDAQRRCGEASILKHAVWPILVYLLFNVGGCASLPSLGEPVNDAPRRAALLHACQRPQATEVVFRTLIHWPGREVSLTEVVKMTPEGGFRAAGITDIGSTLYAVQVAPNGASRVLSKSLPFSDRWLLDGLVAELLIPWQRPHEASQGTPNASARVGEPQLYRQSDGTWTLVHHAGNDLHLFIFDADGNWKEVRRLSGGHLRYRASLEWDGEPIPKIIRVNNPGNHYRAVRERVSLQ